MTATSGTEEKARTDLRTAHEQEDIGTTSRHLKEGRTRRQYSKTPATLGEERGLHRPTLATDPPYPWGTGCAELPDPDVLGTGTNPEGLPGTGRKGTLRSDRGEQEEEPETNGTPKEMTATSETEEKARTDLRTAHEQEDIGTTSRHLKEGRTRRQYSKTPATLGEERGLHRCVGRVKQDQMGGRNQGGKKRQGKDN
ncbi:hypothetical protein NDU88_001974 [Pleurodeles waltl]|uniref:Uncharacterized protein n=1 Tax=Pleurodeles waltl TaxID=8319 RepID=A0AAV7Q8E4_PLEWA|nr:hypothetical protein NDU88_001974 [Pleurodeles waltl]